MAALLGALVLAAAATVARGEKDPAELIVPGGSPTAQEKLDAVQSRLGEVQGDLEKKNGACSIVWWLCVLGQGGGINHPPCPYVWGIIRPICALT